MTGTEHAFNLYCAIPANGQGDVVEPLVPYVYSCVRAWTKLPVGARRDDANSEALLVVLEAIAKRALPSSGVAEFCTAVRKTIISNCARLAQRENVRHTVENAYAQSNGVPPLLVDTLAATELLDGAENLLVQAMLTRARFQAVTPALCKKVIHWYSKDQRNRGLLGSELNSTDYWDRWFMARYLEVLYQWSRCDLRKGLLAS